MKENSPKGVKEIARRANVAIATVDRVIHNRTGVSAKTREKVKKVIAELDYQPNLLASRLASGKIITLAVLIPSVTDETDFWDAPLRGIQRAEQEISQYGVKVESYFFSLKDPKSFTAQTTKILKAGVDGIVLSPSFISEAEIFVAKCKEREIPFVFIDSNLPDQPSLSYIGPPLFQSGYLAGRLCTYSLNEGSKVVLLNITKALDSYTYKQIEKGFRAYFSDQKHSLTILRVDIHQTDFKSVANQLQTLFAKNPTTAAVFVTNSRTSLVARYLDGAPFPKKPILVGYDLVKDNRSFLAKGTIDFLICHQPEDQGYRSVMALYQSLVFSTKINKEYYMPIDIVTKENQAYYRN
ncbi:LacI family DNA-binding transcriptional regulator [Persicitalea jodogahamensis]|uniref:Transcriptional regulator n=1 Tax=Persicitalea jodogahamensis TaxID=402147 RepID=A0A8J3D4W4_9BACT|nr:substrate-binding domain-containing protein [Persicitalea jodogahamensis]GHB74849.1 transcriptional regulator [Persicitalea jodogahamensis]